MTHLFQVRRKPGTPYGQAIGVISDPNGAELARGPVITGKRSVLDPAEYGGVTPPGRWAPIESLDYRDHLRGGDPFTYSRIIPLDDQRARYNRRTYNAPHITDPFMVHYGGSSSGCIGILPQWWESGKKAFNQAFNQGLLIEVVDDPDVDLGEFQEAFEAYCKKYDED